MSDNITPIYFDTRMNEGYWQVGTVFESQLTDPTTGAITTQTHPTRQEACAHYIKALLQRGDKFSLSYVKQTGPNEFKGYIKAPNGYLVHLVGTFETHEQATKGIEEVLSAHWNG